MAYFTQFQKSDYILSDRVVKNVTNLSHYAEIFSRVADNISFYTIYSARPDERLDTISNSLYGTVDYYWTIPILNDSIINTWNDLPKSTNEIVEYMSRKHPGVAFTIRDDQSLAGKFEIGESLIYNSTERATILNKYPSLGFIEAQIESSSSFPLNTEMTLTGETSGDSIVVTGYTEAYNAPVRYVDANGNTVLFDTSNATVVSRLDEERERNDELARIKVIRPEYISDVVKQFEREMKRRRQRVV
jgi:hypothetical protein